MEWICWVLWPFPYSNDHVLHFASLLTCWNSLPNNFLSMFTVSFPIIYFHNSASEIISDQEMIFFRIWFPTFYLVNALRDCTSSWHMKTCVFYHWFTSLNVLNNWKTSFSTSLLARMISWVLPTYSPIFELGHKNKDIITWKKLLYIQLQP